MDDLHPVADATDWTARRSGVVPRAGSAGWRVAASSSKRTLIRGSIVALAAVILIGCAVDRGEPRVDFTWLSNTTWMIEADGIRVFADAAVTRWDFALPDFADPESFDLGPAVSDTAFVRELMSVLATEPRPTYVVVGHGHPDHTVDLAEFAELTDADVIGARTICFEAEAQGLDPERCRVVEGGEVLDLTARLQVRVVRWAHSGNPATRMGRLIQAPKELRAPPPVDPQTGGIGQAPWQGYPNGGGVRAYLFSYRTRGGSLTWLMSDSGNGFTFDSIPQIGPDYLADVGVDMSGLDFVRVGGTPRRWLSEAVNGSGLDSVDVWLGYPGDLANVRQVHDLLPARFFVPHHWDPYQSGFDRLTRPFQRPTLAAYLDSVGVALVPPAQYLDRFELTPRGLVEVPNTALQEAMGLGAH